MPSNNNDLCASLSDVSGLVETTLTRYCKLVAVRGPIVIEKLLDVDQYASLFLLRPWEVAALHLNLHTHLGCRRNIAIYAQGSASVHSEESKDIRALRWCPGPVVFPQ